MTQVRFIHCADLHIDSPFRGVQADSDMVARRLRQASLEAFATVVSRALEEEVDAVLVAGDVFDSADRSLRAQFQFRDELARAADAGISCFVVHGNHDPLDGWTARLEYPDGVTVFGPEVESAPLRRDGETVAVVHGISYPTRDVRDNLAVRFHDDSEAPLNIGLLHCNVGGATGHEPYAACSLTDLTAAGMDYWALGHIHRPQVLHDAEPVVCYAGATQGRDPGETGAHGCYLVELEKGVPPHVRFIPTDGVRWLNEQVALEPEDNIESVRARVEACCLDLTRDLEGRDAIVRLRLTGRTRVNADLRKPRTVEDLLAAFHESLAAAQPFVWIDRLEVATRGLFDRESRLHDPSFIGELLRLSEQLARSDEEGLSELRELLRPVFRHSRAPEGLADYSTDQLRQWLAEAEARCVDLLVEEEEP